MLKLSSLFIAALCLAASVASAAPMTYTITVDTSSISGDAGSLDFNFNPGPLVTQEADPQIENFASDGTLAGSPSTIGERQRNTACNLDL